MLKKKTGKKTTKQLTNPLWSMLGNQIILKMYK